MNSILLVMSHWLLSVPLYLLLCFAKRRRLFPASALKGRGIKQFALLRRDQTLIAIRADAPYRFTWSAEPLPRNANGKVMKRLLRAQP